MNSSRTFPRPFITLLLMLALGFSAPLARATVSVNLDVTPTGGLYHYDVSVINGQSLDLFLVSVNDAPPGDGAVVNPSLVAPAGFLISYDSAGFLDLLANASVFAPGTTTPGFSFNSSFAPAGYFTDFSVTWDNEVQPSIQVNVNLRSVPDSAGTLWTLAMSLGFLVAGRKRFSMHRS